MLDMGLIVRRTCSGLSSPGPHGICNLITLCIGLRAVWSSSELWNVRVYIMGKIEKGIIWFINTLVLVDLFLASSSVLLLFLT